MTFTSDKLQVVLTKSPPSSLWQEAHSSRACMGSASVWSREKNELIAALVMKRYKKPLRLQEESRQSDIDLLWKTDFPSVIVELWGIPFNLMD